MFFNGKKLTQRKPKESRSFMFTDKEVRNHEYDLSATTYSDKGCKSLRISISRNGNHNFVFQDSKVCKSIGSIYTVSVKQARDIVSNIKNNYPEFLEERSEIKLNLFNYFQKFGEFPHKHQGTSVILSDENTSLKEKIRELEEELHRLEKENEELQESCTAYQSRLDTIHKLSRPNFDEE